MARYSFGPDKLAALERCLTIAYRAANWLPDGGIFWMRKSLFAADYYAAVGLADSGLEIEPKECVAFSAGAARKVVSALRSDGVRFIERLEIAASCRGRIVDVTIHYEKNSGYKNRRVASNYVGQWIPTVDIESNYLLFRSHKDYHEFELNVEETLNSLRCRDDIRLPLEYLVPLRMDTRIAVDIGALKAFLAPARSEDTTMLLGYCAGTALPILVRAGDIIGILDPAVGEGSK
jgi:hypothetical protein